MRQARQLGEGLADEAAVSDDVYDAASASEYLELRLALLEGILPPAALPAIRDAFAGKTRDW